jgi:hypothetical protein
MSPPKQEKQENAKPYQWRELYAPANVPNWVLAIVALWAGIMALKTLRAIKQQADLMKAQADHMGEQTAILQDSVAAAKKSADAAESSAIAAMGVAVPALLLEGFAFIPNGRRGP